jgi:FKBP-type peptidyl-prolyl cis-trans isomerase
MKTVAAWSAVVLVCVGIAMPAAGQDGAGELPFTGERERISYAIGMDIGKNFQRQEIEIDADILAAGIRDALAGTSKMTDEQIRSVLMEFQQAMRKKQQERSQRAGTENRKSADKFLQKNKAKPGVVTTASGLQYEVVTQGAGQKPSATNTVKVHYRGTLLSGKEFDSSYRRGQPAEFPVNRVIKGWTEALQLMSVGSKYKLYIPPELGYGERGTGRDIGPNSLLIFEVELLDIVQ